MRNRRTALAHLVGVGCGLAYTYILVQLFGRVLVPNPVNEWLLEKLARAGHEVGYRFAIYSHDFLIYIIVAIPFAFVLSRLAPRNNWTYLLTALVTSLAVQYWALIADPSRLVSVAQNWQFCVGLGMSILGLPLAFAAVAAPSKDETPALPDTA